MVFVSHIRNGRKIVPKQRESLRRRSSKTFLLLDLYIKVDIIGMEFTIEYYKDSAGNSPVDEFLLELAETNQMLFNKTSKGLAKLRNRAYHKEPLSKHLESGLWELRIKAGTDILRIIYTFSKGRIIILLHVFIKKRQKTPSGELEIARKRLKEVKMQK